LAVHAGVENNFVTPSNRKCQPIRILSRVRENTCKFEQDREISSFFIKKLLIITVVMK
jgi:hypothetical protein